MSTVIAKSITYFGKPHLLMCDACCSKAWGINSRPKVSLSDDPDDYAFLADGELGEAPPDPGTYEGGQAKPIKEEGRLNKWCARECERSVMAPQGKTGDLLPDYSRRFPNMPNRHREDANA